MSITIEPVVFSNPAHMSLWYAIRSEKSVREGCRSAKKITVEQHRAWWDESAKSKDRMLYFMRDIDVFPVQTVGILRLDHRGSWMEVWLAVKPEWRHEGVATNALLSISKTAMKMKWPPLGCVINGQRNTASWLLFTKAGFVPSRKGFVQMIQKGRPS